MRTGKTFTRVLKLNNGRLIPQVGLGCYQVNEQEFIENAFNAGYKHFDTAIFYKNDKWVGKELQNHLFMNGFTRDDYFVSSKIPPSIQHRVRTMQVVDDAVANVNAGYLDCMILMLPIASFLKEQNIDPTDVKLVHKKIDAWQALQDKVEMGCIKSAGVSNFHMNHLEHLMSKTTMKPVVN